MLKIMKAKKDKRCSSKEKIKFKMFLVVWCISIIIVILKLVKFHIDTNENRKIRKELFTIYEKVKEEPKKIQENTKIEKLKQLKKINSDIVALIEIKGTNINYPVVQTNNNTYYITHNYRKEKSKEGAIFLDKACDLKKSTKNFLIYGHNNVGSREMFTDLINYKDENFYKAHKIINFVTDEQEEQFEIISVFLARVYYKKEKNVFRYYYFIDADNEKEFYDYINNVKKASLYYIETSAEYNDQLMTLSTCDYSKNNGRLVIVARKVMND